jgi:hypothetical protein
VKKLPIVATIAFAFIAQSCSGSYKDEVLIEEVYNQNHKEKAGEN